MQDENDTFVNLSFTHIAGDCVHCVCVRVLYANLVVSLHLLHILRPRVPSVPTSAK